MGPVLVLIRDGWGYRRSKKDNAIAQGNTPYTDELMRKYPHILLDASDGAVGLPKGFQGNSEVGHITIGSGRIPLQPLTRINKSIADRSFFKNKAFLKAINNCKKHHSAMHIMGLLQDEGVHSHIDHLYALLRLMKQHRLKKVYVHVFTDGRDAPPTAAKQKIKKLQEFLRRLGVGEIATISGRYYAMDRDRRWARTKKAYDAIIEAKAPLIVPLEQCYKSDETDEFLIPRISPEYKGVQDNDSIIFFNFRTDRPRQLTQAIVEKNFKGFKRTPKKVCFVAMTDYYSPMNALVAFRKIKLKNVLGEVLSKHNLKQLRISETEKYAHVTFFFNGENEVPFKGEDRILIPSPKVATYDLKPEMSAYEITKRAIKEIDKEKYDVIIMNIVNGDMVGHTGVIKACLKAVEVVDECVHMLATKILAKEGVALIFADHGNIEDQTEKWRTSHTLNPVPFILVSNKKYNLREHGGLSDVAPTVLDLLGIKKPKEMTGVSLIKEDLITTIKKLKKSLVGREVGKRIKEFESFRNKPSLSWFSELCFCILTANSKAETAISIQRKLGAKNFLKMSASKLSEAIKAGKHRFHNNKAAYIIEARKYKQIKTIITKIADTKGLYEAREWLVKNIKGIGYKEASHFLRNVGYKDVAIIDRHILRVMKENKLIPHIPKKPLNKARYLMLEKKLSRLASELNISLAELDLYLWQMKTGRVLK